MTRMLPHAEGMPRRPTRGPNGRPLHDWQQRRRQQATVDGRALRARLIAIGVLVPRDQLTRENTPPHLCLSDLARWWFDRRTLELDGRGRAEAAREFAGRTIGRD